MMSWNEDRLLPTSNRQPASQKHPREKLPTPFWGWRCHERCGRARIQIQIPTQASCHSNLSLPQYLADMSTKTMTMSQLHPRDILSTHRLPGLQCKTKDWMTLVLAINSKILTLKIITMNLLTPLPSISIQRTLQTPVHTEFVTPIKKLWTQSTLNNTLTKM